MKNTPGMSTRPDNTSVVFSETTYKLSVGRFLQPFKYGRRFAIKVHAAAGTKVYFTTAALQYGYNKIIAESAIVRFAAIVFYYPAGMAVHYVEPMIEGADPNLVTEAPAGREYYDKRYLQVYPLV